MIVHGIGKVPSNVEVRNANIEVKRLKHVKLFSQSVFMLFSNSVLPSEATCNVSLVRKD
jgi:hypothetical protein